MQFYLMMKNIVSKHLRFLLNSALMVVLLYHIIAIQDNPETEFSFSHDKLIDGVNLVLAHRHTHGLFVTDVGVDKGIATSKTLGHVFQVVRVPGIGQLVVNDHFVISVTFQHIARKIGTNKTGPTSN